MNVFIGMECSQVIQRAFEERGHNAWSCDLKPAVLNPSRHIQGDVHTVLTYLSWTPDLIILHPVCRFLSSSGWHWKHPGRYQSKQSAIMDFMRCTFHGPHLCIENPIGIMSTLYRQPDQILQPYEFGDDASKSTCLWLTNLPPLHPTSYYPPRMINGLPRWSNQTNSGQNRLLPTFDPEDRRSARAVTYPGIARAMASQWCL